MLETIEYLISSEFYQIMLFYVYSGILIGSALAVVTMRNSIYSALFLILSFFSAAALWMLLEAEFLALTIVLVYVGAVMVLFLFVIMMLDVKITPKKDPAKGASIYKQTGFFVAILMALEMIMLLGGKLVNTLPQDDLIKHAKGHSNVKEVAETLYTQYVLPFELASVILLVAIVAAILLTLRKRDDYKHVDPETQVHVKAKDRVRIIKMDTEKGNYIGGDE